MQYRFPQSSRAHQLVARTSWKRGVRLRRRAGYQVATTPP